jgi:hypothetical protein
MRLHIQYSSPSHVLSHTAHTRLEVVLSASGPRYSWGTIPSLCVLSIPKAMLPFLPGAKSCCACVTPSCKLS